MSQRISFNIVDDPGIVETLDTDIRAPITDERVQECTDDIARCHQSKPIKRYGVRILDSIQ